MAFRFYQAQVGDLVVDNDTNDSWLLTDMKNRDEYYRWFGINIKEGKRDVVFTDWDVYGVCTMDLYRNGEQVLCEVPP